MERASGILLPLFSLPSLYGIGTMGRAAYEFADFLHAAGQRYWQLLPLGPTGYGDSPYQSFSTYAGNPYFIDLELLAEDGLLTQAELSAREWGNDPRRVDYGAVYENRLPLLRLAKARGWQRDRDAVAAFAALLLFSHVQYTVLNGEVASLRSQMTKLQSDNATLSAQYEKVFDLDTIQNTVGDTMVRPTGDQVVYIDLSEPDSVVLYGQEEGQGGLSGAIQSVKTIVGDMIEYFR